MKEQPSPLSWLALGDSYTIGESVPIYESFPYQTVQYLRAAGTPCYAPEIVARTGWTTQELHAGIMQTRLLVQYDLVSLLIGVNNQYRGMQAEQYPPEFEKLLDLAIQKAGHHPARVFVLSIPDWGVTPFAQDRDRAAIARDIDAYNHINRTMTLEAGAHYIDITPFTREGAHQPGLVAADGLHPSGKDYARWAQSLSKAMLTQISST